MVIAENEPKNLDIRLILMFYQELYIRQFYYSVNFSPYDATVARKVKAFCDEYDVQYEKYVFICFKSKVKEMEQHRFSRMATDWYVQNFTKLALSTTKWGANSTPTSIYDIMRGKILRYQKDNLEEVPTEIIYKVLNDVISPTMLVYMMKLNLLNPENYRGFISHFPKKMSKCVGKVNALIEKKVLPDNLTDLENHLDHKVWFNRIINE
jgi:hypothetical protein